MGQFLFADLRESVKTRKCSGCESVHSWSWISHQGAGVLLCIEGQLDSLHYQHILQDVMVPSVLMLYPDGIIHLHQDHPSIHDSRVAWMSAFCERCVFLKDTAGTLSTAWAT